MSNTKFVFLLFQFYANASQESDTTVAHRETCNMLFRHVNINATESMRNEIEKQQKDRLQKVLDEYAADMTDLNFLDHHRLQTLLIDAAMHFVKEILKHNHSADIQGKTMGFLTVKRPAIELCVIWKELCDKVVLEFMEYMRSARYRVSECIDVESKVERFYFFELGLHSYREHSSFNIATLLPRRKTLQSSIISSNEQNCMMRTVAFCAI